ncbi:hypothetical protein BH20ACT16_BH20ACT16_13180 [soil metagenome]
MTWPVASGSLLLGFAVAQVTGIRPLGGIVLIAGCGWCALRWLRIRPAGTARTAVLVVVYIGSFVLSHVVADSLGAWPSVLLAAAVTGIAVYVLADSAGARGGAGVSPARARP